MSRWKKGKAVTWLLLAVVFGALLLSGCGSPKYEAVTLGNPETEEASGSGEKTDVPESGGKPSAETETMVSLTLGDMSGSGDEDGQSGDAGSGEGSGETEPADPYETVDEVVVVTADILNVRASDNQSARIYAQLKRGSTLKRTGYTSEWSRVNYDGKTAYVSSSMVEVQEPETAAETEGGEESPAPDIPAAAGADAAEAAAEEPVGEGQPEGEGTGVPLAGMRAAAEPSEPEIPFNGHTIAIDAGHQAKANSEKEPIGPGSTTMKAKMSESYTGVISGVKEHELTLSVAQKLEEELKNRGYHVVMTRESNDVNLSNAERASIANKSEAEIFIRLHANSMDNSSVYGALAMCMTEQNPYNAGLYGKSYALSKKIIDSICAHTGTKNRGVQEVDNSSGINWSEIPVSVVEMGFMSNPDEDRWMQEESYQGKIVAGIAAAVDSYFAEGN